MVTLPKDFWEGVADYRFENRINTESEAIRRLIELGLEAAKLDPAQPKKTPSA